MRTAAALVLLAACARSPLIRPDDPQFGAAQARLVATQARVQQEAGSPAGSGLFLQAESFYRYRRAISSLHDARSYALQAVAAALDCGPFSALASANGVADLRLAVRDGAARLYEAHLARLPRSKLAPLALWRLGWSAFMAAHPDAP
ncbi:MAG TPA: hypothetical protein VLW85_22905 [Myxococcales bacterium]|nr:hypothetical protein [Myxococcales bacterium]